MALMFEGLQLSGLSNLSSPDLKPRFNICPTQAALCVRQQESGLKLDGLRWGLVPFWAKDLKVGARMINARSETVASKPAFRAAFKSRRCLVIADGFYEWKKSGSQKQPWYVSRNDGAPYCMAGLWESWTDPQPGLFDAEGESEQTVETCTILTSAANDFMAPLHNRMPVMIDDPDTAAFWLDPEFSDAERLESCLRPRPWEGFGAVPVSQKVNFVRNDGPELITPIEQ